MKSTGDASERYYCQWANSLAELTFPGPRAESDIRYIFSSNLRQPVPRSPASITVLSWSPSGPSHLRASCNWPPFNPVRWAQFCLNSLTSYLVFLLRCSLYKYEFCEISYCMGCEIWWYAPLKGDAWSWRRSAQSSIEYSVNYIPSTSLDVLDTNLERDQSKIARVRQSSRRGAVAIQEFQSPL